MTTEDLAHVVCENVRYVPAWEIGIAVGIAVAIVIGIVAAILTFWLRDGKDNGAGSGPLPRTAEVNVTPRRRPVSRR